VPNLDTQVEVEMTTEIQTHVTQPSQSGRIAWIDFSKGVCIILVVLLHANESLEIMFETQTWLHDFIEWARPFRMPDFFLIAGLFLSRRIDHPWRSYLDSKVLHFAYFYIIWMSVWYVLQMPDYIAEDGPKAALLRYPLSFIQPLGTLWFIYILPVFFVTVKLLRRSPVWMVWLAAVVIHALHIQTGWKVIDEFSARFVFFYSGYAFAPIVFSLAKTIGKQSTAAILTGLVIWAYLEAVVVFSGWAKTAPIELIIGYIGTLAVVIFGILFSRYKVARFIGYAGQNSIVIFLSYFLFMAGLRMVILKAGIPISPGSLAAVITVAGVVGPLIALKLVKGTPLIWIYRRHKAFYLPEQKHDTSKSIDHIKPANLKQQN